MRISIASFQEKRLQSITEAVHLAYTNAVEGDIAEFGIGSVTSSFQAIAATMKLCDYLSGKYRTQVKTLHGFDSFQGFPKATKAEDLEMPMIKTGTWGEGKELSPGEAKVRELVTQYLPDERVKLYAGWFNETMPQIPPDTRFALVHLDCDLYESTAQVLDYLFSNKLLSDGCQLLFDDFLENRMSKKLGQRKAWSECIEKFNVDFTDIGLYGRASWRFVVHVD